MVRSESLEIAGGIIQMSLTRARDQRPTGAENTRPAANAEQHQRLVRANDRVETALSPSAERSCWDCKTEPAVSQSRESATSPPAAAGSFHVGSKRSRRPAVALGMAVLITLTMSSCSNVSPTASGASVSVQSPSAESSHERERSEAPKESSKDTVAESTSGTSRVNTTKAPKDAAEQPKPSEQPTEEPTPDITEEASFSGVAFEPSKGGPQNIERPGDSVSEEDRIEADVDAKTNHVDYADGVSIVLGSSERGTVQSEGPGYFTGAPYRVFEISVDNKSAGDLDLSSVFVTLSLGKKHHVALPLYGEVEAFDFNGVLPKGEKATSSYAFIIPAGSKTGRLSIDLDASHAVAVLDTKVR